jgi:hypothetical protein
MRAAEGKALVKGAASLQMNPDTASKPSSIDYDPPSNNNLAPLPIRPGPPSPAYVPPRVTPSPCQDEDVGQARPRDAASSSAKSSAYSLHTATLAAIDDALREFSDRVRHLFRLFELSASSTLSITASSFEDLVAAASWWFLRGRTNIESTVKDRPSSPRGWSNYNILRQQGHADLAKALWIVSDILPQRPEIGTHRVDDLTPLIETVRDTGNEYLADILDRCQAIHANLRKVAESMKRHDCLPPPVEEAPLPQGIDTTIWIVYPSFTSDIRALLSGQNSGPLLQIHMPPKKISDLMPLGDTREAFSYGRMWVDILLMEERVESQQFRCPSILSITRSHKEKGLALTTASQTGVVAFCIRSDKANGLTWNDVTWQARNNTIELKLPRGFIARVQCSPNDFKILWNMYDYTSKVHANFQPRKSEDILLEKTVKTFQYFDRDSQSRVFPKEPVPKCHVRIFEKKLTEIGGNGAHSKHRGLRIAIITNSSTKNLSGVTHELPTRRPIQYSFMRGEEGAPALLLSVNEGSAAKKPTMVLSFDDIHSRSDMHGCITGGARKGEAVSQYIHLKHFSVTAVPSQDSPKADDVLNSFEWQGIQVINTSTISNAEPEIQQVVRSEHLRVVVDSKSGILTDRINVGPGELRLRLRTQPSINEISLLRQPQEDLTISVSESQVAKEAPQEVAELLGAIAKSRTIRKYGFSTIEDLHTFQTAVTGFSVLFDGTADSFAISRRRMVVPIYKKREASIARVQVLRQDKAVQLAAFFENFSHGECMNFALKMTDIFESFGRNGKFCIRIVDAKFSALKDGDETDEDINQKFVCLDMPNYPGEHDDITITFDSEASTFTQCK